MSKSAVISALVAGMLSARRAVGAIICLHGGQSTCCGDGETPYALRVAASEGLVIDEQFPDPFLDRRASSQGREQNGRRETPRRVRRSMASGKGWCQTAL